MKSTFNLKEPNKDGETSIRLVAYFKNEGKKLIYSTGETIHPNEWDFNNIQPNNLTGRTPKAEAQRTIKRQLDRYSNFFIEITNRYINSDQEITIENIRAEFDKEFKKTKAQSNNFFKVYDLFLEMKKLDQTDEANSVSTISRYEYNKTLLQEYETYSKTSLHLNKIDKAFYNSYISYCVSVKKHSTNTLSRNLGLLKTFLFWAFNNNYTYKADFKEFKNIKKQITDEVALTMEQVTEIFEFDFSDNERLEKVRDLFVFGCVTGMRFSNYSTVKKNDIQNGFINVRDLKDKNKELSIPLNDYSSFILKKYNYKLPLITNQKFNDYIKEVIQKVGYTDEIKKTIKLGQDLVESVSPFYERVSSHTARRSFITIMKNKKIPDKVIMGFTGHKSLEVFNQYYKPNTDDKIDFMQTVWKMEKAPLKKVD